MKIGVILPAAEVDGNGAIPPWNDVRAFAEAADSRGLDSVWMFDHFFNRTDEGVIEGMYESWTILSAVAAVTERVQLGTQVMCTSFRSPGLLAHMATTLDEVSHGRLILGIGAGWHDPEYEAFGYPIDHRGARFEETLRVLRRLLDGETVTFEGMYSNLRGAVLAPAPSRHIPIHVAGDGPRILRSTARYADGWNDNGYGAPDNRLRHVLRRLDEALDAEGRDRATLERTIGVSVRQPGTPIAEDDEPTFSGSPAEMAEMFAAYAELAIAHLTLEVGPKTVPSLDLIAEAAALYRSAGS